MKASELRLSILQTAVQGKLVSQNIHDEPAAELLERIRKERSRLVKEGKIKKEKPLPPIVEEEIPYDLPVGWVWCRLNEIYNFIDYRGKTPTKTNFGIPLITGANIKKGYMDYSKKWFVSSEEFETRKSRGISKKGDILFTTEAPLGHVALADIDVFTAGQRIITMQSYDRELTNKLYVYFLLSPDLQKRIYEKRSGMTATGIKAALLKLVIVPLPPLAEQKRIVAKVDELMTLCDELESAEKELNNLEEHFKEYLPKSILQMAVQGKLVPQNIHDEPASELLERISKEKALLVKEGKIKKEKPLPPIAEDEIPYDLPEGWVWCRLGEICNYGVCINVKPTDIPMNAWLLELEDVEKDTGKIQKHIERKERSAKSTKHYFESGQVLYGKLRPYLNKVLVASDNGYCSSEILPLSFGEINAYYAVLNFRCPRFIDYANSKVYGVKMPRLGTNDARLALFSLPPLAEQQRIVAKVNKLMALCDELKIAYDTSVPYSDMSKVISFPVKQEEEQLRMVAQGTPTEEQSKELSQAIDDLFGDDEYE